MAEFEATKLSLKTHLFDLNLTIERLLAVDLMQSGRVAVRPLCSARNAYNVAAALFSALAVTTTRQCTARVRNERLNVSSNVRLVHLETNAVNSKPAEDLSNTAKVRETGSTTHPNELRHKHLKLRQQSVTRPQAAPSNNREALEESTSINEVLEQDSRRLGQGSTYSNHENLRELSAAPETPKKSSSNIPRIRTGSEDIPLAKLKGPYPVPAHMQQLATVAGRLARVKVKLSDRKFIEARRQELDYRGRNVEIEAARQQQNTPMPWALSSDEKVGKSGEDILGEEIRRFSKYVEFTSHERIARDAVIADLRDFIATTLGPEVRVELFGSQRTGLASAMSDIDIRLDCDIDDAEAKYKYLTTKMNDLVAAMKHNEDYTLVTARHGRFPIINTSHRRTGMDLQIVAAPSTAPQDDITLQYMDELPHVRSLYLLLRSALGARNLVDVFYGGTGSYGLFIMLVASIKRPSSSPPETMAQQLLRFLDFYADLDTRKHGISLTPPKLLKKHDVWEIPVKTFVDAAHRRGDEVRAGQWAISQRRLYQPYLLCLQDPVNPTNDLGRKSNAIKHVIATLKHLRSKLKTNMKHVDRIAKKGDVWNGQSIFSVMVRYTHEVNAERRRKVEEYGLEVAQRRMLEGEGEDDSVTEAAIGASG